MSQVPYRLRFAVRRVFIRLNAQRANVFYNREGYLQPRSSKSPTAIILIVIISIKVNNILLDETFLLLSLFASLLK